MLAVTSHCMRAVAVGMLLLTSAYAAEIQRLGLQDETYVTILNATKGYYQAWSYTRESDVYDQAGRFYSKNPNNVYWDPLPPLEGFRGWNEYRSVIETVWKPAGVAAAAILFAHDNSFRAWQHGDVVWTTGNCVVRTEGEDGQAATSACRGLQVWEKQAGEWLIAHELFSSTVHPAGGLFQGTRKADGRIRPDPEFKRLSQDIARRWGVGPVADAAGRLRPYYGTDAVLHLYMPWAPHDGHPDWASFQAGLRDYLALGVQTLRLVHNDDVEVTRRDDVAWSTGTVHFQFIGNDDTAFAAGGRQSRIWHRQGDQWLVVHEHLAIPMGH